MKESNLIMMAYGKSNVGMFNLTLTEEKKGYRVMVKKTFFNSLTGFLTEVNDFFSLKEAQSNYFELNVKLNKQFE